MKRIAAFSVVLCLAGLFGCGGGGNNNNNSTPTQPTLSSITVTPSTSTLWVALSTQQFTATGHYSDGTTKDLSAVANWSSSSPSVAVVSASGVGTPLAAGTVTISAMSGGVSGTSTVTVVGLATGYIAPSGATLSLTGSPSAAQLSATAVWTDGKTQDLTSSMTWSSSDTSVATVSASGNVSRAENAGYATISAASKTFSLSTAVSVTNQSMSNGDFSGSYVFVLNGVDASGPVFNTGTFAADGSGNLTGQLTSTSSAGIIAMPTPFTGTYSVFPDGRGDMTMALPSPLSTTRLRFVLGTNGTQGRFMLFDPTKNTAMTGVFQKQYDTPFTAASLHGNYVFKLGGTDSANKPQTLVGMLGADGAGQVVSGTADWNDNGRVNNGNGRSAPLAVLGSYIVSSDGHGSMTLNVGSTQMHFAMFLVSNGLFRLLCTDPGQHLLGQVELQQTPDGGFQATEGAWTFLLEDGGRAGVFGMGGDIQMGPMSSVGGWVSRATGVQEDDLEIEQFARNIGLDGRGTLDLTFFVRRLNTYANYSFAVYMVSPTRMYWIETDTQSVYSGLAMGAGSGPLNGSYIYMGGALGVASGTESSVLGLLNTSTLTNTSGTFKGIVDVNLPATITPGVTRVFGTTVADGTFAVDPNSIYTKWQASISGQSFTFYVNSSFQALMFGQTGVSDNPELEGWMTTQ